MLSVRLADALLGAVGPRTHVLLVGDVDQLAPVGPGRVLEDLIESGAVPTVRLTEIFRQAARSLIVRAAHAINAGQPPPTVAGDDDIRDFFFLERPAPATAFEDVCDIAVRRLPATYGLDPAREILVLSPMHKGPLGIEAFNAELRRRLNADGEPVPGSAVPRRRPLRPAPQRPRAPAHERRDRGRRVGRRRERAADAAVRRRPRAARALRRRATRSSSATACRSIARRARRTARS